MTNHLEETVKIVRGESPAVCDVCGYVATPEQMRHFTVTMCADGVIDAIVYGDKMDTIYLRPRIDSDGQSTIPGRRRLLITRNPDYTPHPGDEIWGNGHEVVISKDGVDHKFRRVMRLWDGTYEVMQ